ncbi:hypothetical protein QAD02_020918 [Eretmocerus hayati]|uniref:Uncharacterized protein n=1 Tax=Eretmocerus hayati TaxID=131215 RepID=A0ACC2PTK5_9HYME|nr:hypothetical protein QAD02_020918 [Eretmocerus hayati]
MATGSYPSAAVRERIPALELCINQHGVPSVSSVRNSRRNNLDLVFPNTLGICYEECLDPIIDDSQFHEAINIFIPLEDQCLHLLTQDNGLDWSESKLPFDHGVIEIEIDQIAIRFLDLARQVEAFFLQKRFLLTALKPELIIKEEIADLKAEMLRKEDLVKKHNDKIYIWQNLLAEMHGWVNGNDLIFS